MDATEVTIPLPLITILSDPNCSVLEWDVIQVSDGVSMLAQPLQQTSFSVSGDPQADTLTIGYDFDSDSATRY